MKLSRRSVLVCGAALVALALAAPASATAPAGRYTVSLNTVFDTKTGLTWQRAALPVADQTGAAAACGMSLVGGRSGWRLPNIKELASLVDVSVVMPSNSNPAIDGAAFPTVSGAVWSSNVVAGDATQGWDVDFNTGGNFALSNGVFLGVLCVQ